MSGRTRSSSPETIGEDVRFMAAALEIARRGWGRVAPNPAVGALVVKNGFVIGRGTTAPGGRPHAEVLALQEAGAEAKGATLYVTLEPCSHHGRTPPCVDAVIAAGIARVVSTIDDPDPRVSGQGYHRLRSAGIDVETGVLVAPALRANLGHILRVCFGRPMITLKMAETADGFAAGAERMRRLMITGASANNYVHMLRAMHDGVLIGSGTAIADDPLLSVRLPGLEARKPLRIVLDSNLTLPPTARLVTTARDQPSLVITGEGSSEEVEAKLASQGVEVVRVARNPSGEVDLPAAVTHLGTLGLTRVLCEGGPRLAAALIGRNFANEVLLLRSDEPLGAEGVPALDSASRAALADSRLYTCRESGRIGTDTYMRYERVL